MKKQADNEFLAKTQSQNQIVIHHALITYWNRKVQMISSTDMLAN